jgi:hypothetical protein
MITLSEFLDQQAQEEPEPFGSPQMFNAKIGDEQDFIGTLAS